jgi:hypothetical protein
LRAGALELGRHTEEIRLELGSGWNDNAASSGANVT